MEDPRDAYVALAQAWWLNDGASQAWDDVDEMLEHQLAAVPELIRALAVTAPDGALSYIGVCILEDLSTNAHLNDVPDPALDVLLASNLDPAVAYEVLSGPYPEYLERWGVRERLGAMYTHEQLNALYNWSDRHNRRLAYDGAGGYQLLPVSGWFKTAP